jgi:hypothetical protein
MLPDQFAVMKRRTLLTRTGAGLATLSTVALAGCSDDGGTETTDGGDASEPLPELTVSEQTLQSTVDQLAIAGQQIGLRRGTQHEDIHFAVTLSVTNEGDQRIDLDDYGYQLDLYDSAENRLELGQTWAIDGDALDPGETGSVLVQLSFIDTNATPEDVDSYRLVLGCGSGNSAYC